ncbi:hypothetical protein FKM82_019870 [Ascaphus truei]
MITSWTESKIRRLASSFRTPGKLMTHLEETNVRLTPRSLEGKTPTRKRPRRPSKPKTILLSRYILKSPAPPRLVSPTYRAEYDLSGVICFHYGQKGHLSWNCPEKKNSNLQP